jgi:hypothetical protein
VGILWGSWFAARFLVVRYERVSGKQQHYLPAALIGGFGVAAASGRLREATVAVRRTATGAVDPVDPRAESIASLPGIYRCGGG